MDNFGNGTRITNGGMTAQQKIKGGYRMILFMVLIGGLLTCVACESKKDRMLNMVKRGTMPSFSPTIPMELYLITPKGQLTWEVQDMGGGVGVVTATIKYPAMDRDMGEFRGIVKKPAEDIKFVFSVNINNGLFSLDKFERGGQLRPIENANDELDFYKASDAEEENRAKEEQSAEAEKRAKEAQAAEAEKLAKKKQEAEASANLVKAKNSPNVTWFKGLTAEDTLESVWDKIQDHDGEHEITMEFAKTSLPYESTFKKEQSQKDTVDGFYKGIEGIFAKNSEEDFPTSPSACLSFSDLVGNDNLKDSIFAPYAADCYYLKSLSITVHKMLIFDYYCDVKYIFLCDLGKIIDKLEGKGDYHIMKKGDGRCHLPPFTLTSIYISLSSEQGEGKADLASGNIFFDKMLATFNEKYPGLQQDMKDQAGESLPVTEFKKGLYSISVIKNPDPSTSLVCYTIDQPPLVKSLQKLDDVASEIRAKGKLKIEKSLGGDQSKSL